MLDDDDTAAGDTADPTTSSTTPPAAPPTGDEEPAVEEEAVEEPLRLNEQRLGSVVAVLKAKGVEAVAIGFLHAYANPSHEERAAALVRKLWPEVYLCMSSEVLAEFREFERFALGLIVDHDFSGLPHQFGLVPSRRGLNQG